MGQGTSGVRFARIYQARVACPPRPRAFRDPELRGCLLRKWLERYGARHLGIQTCKDVAGE
eukprot:1006831-Pyramimonas_sp.AAC.1